VASKHGTRARYLQGCRCDPCRAAQSAYHRGWRERRAAGLTRSRPNPVAGLPQAASSAEAGRVELAVAAEIDDLAIASARPGLVETVLAMAKILDSPKVPSSQPAAAGKLMTALEALRSSGQKPRGKLAVVKGDDHQKTVP